MGLNATTETKSSCAARKAGGYSMDPPLNQNYNTEGRKKEKALFGKVLQNAEYSQVSLFRDAGSELQIRSKEQ